jgi:hypothetical protein
VAIGTTVRTNDPGTGIGWRCPVMASCFDNLGPSPVTTTETVIAQFGPNNIDYLGAWLGGPAPVVDATGYAFTTGYLDVYTGTGGALVEAAYVNILVGALGLFGPFNLNSGGPANSNILLLDTDNAFSYATSLTDDGTFTVSAFDGDSERAPLNAAFSRAVNPTRPAPGGPRDGQAGHVPACLHLQPEPTPRDRFADRNRA